MIRRGFPDCPPGQYNPIGFYAGMRGRIPYSSRGCEPPAPLLFFFRKKKRRGRKEKTWPTDAQEKNTSNLFRPICLRLRSPWGRPPLEERGYAPFFTPHVGNKSCKIFGAIVRNSAYQPGSVSFSRATSALTRVVYLSDHPNCTIRWGLPVLRRRALSIKIR